MVRFSVLCRERHRYYAHEWPCRQFVIISTSPQVTGDFHPSATGSDAKLGLDSQGQGEGHTRP